MLYDETQQLLQLYFLLEYWGNEYKRFRVDLRQRLELPFADALENPAVITGLTYHERRERFGKKGQKLKKDAYMIKRSVDLEKIFSSMRCYNHAEQFEIHFIPD